MDIPVNNLMGAVATSSATTFSSLTPVMIPILGLILGFFVIEQILGFFKTSTENKKEIHPKKADDDETDEFLNDIMYIPFKKLNAEEQAEEDALYDSQRRRYGQEGADYYASERRGLKQAKSGEWYPKWSGYWKKHK